MRERVTLEEYLARMGGASYGRLREVYRRVLEGELQLEDPRPPSRFIEVLSRLDYSLWYWAVVAVVASTLATIALSDAVEPLRYARYVLGSVYVLLLPGYSTIEALYPEEGSLKPLERLALSIGLSLAIVPLIGLILNYTFGIRLWPVALTLALYTIAVATIGLYRKYLLVRLESEARSQRLRA